MHGKRTTQLGTVADGTCLNLGHLHRVVEREVQPQGVLGEARKATAWAAVDAVLVLVLVLLLLLLLLLLLFSFLRRRRRIRAVVELVHHRAKAPFDAGLTVGQHPCPAFKAVQPSSGRVGDLGRVDDRKRLRAGRSNLLQRTAYATDRRAGDYDGGRRH